jgi:hypothetical protein
MFLILRLISNLNLKFNTYDKIKNFKEIWLVNYYDFDKYIYYSIFFVIQFIGSMRRIKLLVLINWWVIIFFLVVF